MLEIGQNVLLSSQDNINFIHEILTSKSKKKQNFFFYLNYLFVICRVILCPVKMV
jgi:hypothetical protein